MFLVSVFAGYWFLRQLNWTRLPTLRSGGYHVLLESVLAGSVLVIIVRGTFWIWDKADVGSLSLAAIFSSISPQDPHYFHVIIGVIAGAFALPILMNLIAGLLHPPLISGERLSLSYKPIRHRFFLCRKVEMVEIEARRKGDLSEMMLLKSMYKRQLVKIGLRNGQMYIGLVAAVIPVMDPRYGEENNDIALIPVMEYQSSDIENLKPDILVQAIENLEQKVADHKISDEDLQTAIRRSSIISIHSLPLPSEEPAL